MGQHTCGCMFSCYFHMQSWIVTILALDMESASVESVLVIEPTMEIVVSLKVYLPHRTLH